MTFFDFPGIPQGSHGTNEIYRISLRVPSDDALHYWVRRFGRLNIQHDGIQTQFGSYVLPFTDFDNQQYQLISDEHDEGVEAGTPWRKGPIPDEYAIRGLGRLHVRVDDLDHFQKIMKGVLRFAPVAQEGDFYLFEVGEGGHGAQVLVEYNAVLPNARQGYGTIHHAAFRVADREGLDEWTDRMRQFRLPNSGYVNRFYFESLYTRVAPQILFEIATDGPGFMEDEDYETLGEALALPPDFEGKRSEIEQYVRYIDTVRSDKTIEKEYE